MLTWPRCASAPPVQDATEVTLKTEVEAGASGYSVTGGGVQGIFVKHVLKGSSAAKLFSLREGAMATPPGSPVGRATRELRRATHPAGHSQEAGGSFPPKAPRGGREAGWLPFHAVTMATGGGS